MCADDHRGNTLREEIVGRLAYLLRRRGPSPSLFHRRDASYDPLLDAARRIATWIGIECGSAGRKEDAHISFVRLHEGEQVARGRFARS
jgi:hypothetical protein